MLLLSLLSSAFVLLALRVGSLKNSANTSVRYGNVPCATWPRDVDAGTPIQMTSKFLVVDMCAHCSDIVVLVDVTGITLHNGSGHCVRVPLSSSEMTRSVCTLHTRCSVSHAQICAQIMLRARARVARHRLLCTESTPTPHRRRTPKGIIAYGL